MTSAVWTDALSLAMIGVGLLMIGVCVSGGTTTSITVRFLVALLDEANRPPDRLLSEAEISRNQLNSPDLRFPIPAFDRLWTEAAALRPDIGLCLIDRFPPGQMHVVTHLAMRSASVGEALASVVRFIRVTDSDDRMSLEIEGESAAFCYSNALLAGGARHNPWIVEHFLSMAWRFMSQACGRDLPLRAVQFIAAAQAPTKAYLTRFGKAPAFNVSRNALVFAREALDWPLLTHDQYLHSILESFACERLPAAAESLGDRARDVLRRGWLDGRPLDLAKTANACGIGRDTLRSKLAEQQLGFRQLKDETRRDLAKVYLAGRLSTGEVAYLLGFSEAAALQHAVKRWFGLPVGEFRRALWQVAN